MKNQIIDIALGQFGIREISGVRDNPEVLKYFNALGFNGTALKDETAWCAAYVNWVLMQAGLKGSGKLNARSLLQVGKPTEKPQKGDIVVLWRISKKDWRGHTGFFIRETKNWVYILGGNQGNRVSIQAYPKNRVLEYRTAC